MRPLNSPDEIDEKSNLLTPRSGRLYPDQIEMIEEAMACAGEFGEVRLIIERGRLRFVVVERSFDALKWRPGKIISK
jgi:hypothetical protein